MNKINIKRLEQFKAALSDSTVDLDTALERFIQSSHPPAYNELLRRCALVRSFDRELIECVLSKDLSAPVSFGEFVKLSEIETVPRSQAYSVTASVRQRYEEEWRRDREAWVQWNRRLLAFYEAYRTEDTLNRLYHLIPADPEKALRFFERAFDKADKRFDLAECFSLLMILKSREGDLGPDLAAARLEKQQHYQSRALFADAYYRTGTYYRREAPLAEFQQILNSETQWVFHLHATGGMGKTMFLRWLIARRLIPQHIPCARVDLDDYHLENVRRAPWLLLLPISEQLNKQLPNPYLKTFVLSLQPYDIYLKPPMPGQPQEAKTPLLDPDQGKAFPELFANLLKDLKSSSLVIVLDTLEGITLYQDACERLFRQMEALHESVPSLQLVLSGRYDIRLKVPQLQAALNSQAVTHELSRFANEEAHAYLRSRGLEQEAMLDAIVAKVSEPREDEQPAGCNPFKLALFAELVLSREGLTVDDVKQLPSADFAYLLERVIKRIPEQPLRWVVRYGALPRRLTLAFIENVLLEPLRAVLAGELIDDQPKEKRYLPQGLENLIEQDIWKPVPGVQVETAQLWEDLCRYESGRGWITRVQEQVVQFHGDVVDPMRYLLSYQPIFHRLQTAAITYFERLADSNPERWGDWISEAIFHRFQRDGAQAEDYWRQQLAAPQAQSNPCYRQQIAAEILRREYAEEESTPRLFGKRPALVTLPMLAKAHLEVVQSMLAQANGWFAPESEEWPEINRHMTLCLAIEKTPSESFVPPVMRSAFEAAVLSSDKKYENAARLLRETLAQVRTLIESFHLHIQLGDVLKALNDPETPHHYQAAIALYPRLLSLTITPPLTEVYLKMSDWYARKNQTLLTKKKLEAALLEANRLKKYQIQLSLASLAHKTGNHDEGLELIAKVKEQATSLSIDEAKNIDKAEPELIEASIWLALKYPSKAIKCAQNALKLAGNRREAQAHAHDIQGMALGELMSFSEAFDHWDEALRLLSGDLYNNRQADCAIHRIRLKGKAMGNYKDALVMAQEAESQIDRQNLTAWVSLQLERIFLLQRTGQTDESRSLLAQLLAPHNEGWHAELRVQTIATGLALDLLPATDANLHLLLAGLREIDLPVTCLTVLEIFQYCSQVISESADWHQHLMALLPTPEPGKPSFLLNSLRLAEVNRVFGAADSARNLLENINTVLKKDIDYYILFLMLTAYRRLGKNAPEALLQQFNDLYEQVEPSFLAGAIQLELAEAKQHDASDEEMRLLLVTAKENLAKEKLLTRWHTQVDEQLGKVLSHIEEDTLKVENALKLLFSALDNYRLLGDVSSQQRINDLFNLLKEKWDKFDKKNLSKYATAAAVGGLALYFLPKLINISSNGKEKQEPGAILISRKLVLLPVGSEERVPLWEQQKFLKKLNPEPTKNVAGFLPNWLTDDWRKARQELKALLMTEEDERRLKDSSLPTTLHLLIPHNFLSGLPWELIQYPGETPEQAGNSPLIRCCSRVAYSPEKHSEKLSRHAARWVQTALKKLGKKVVVDGIYGPATAAAAREFLQQPIAPEPGAELFKPLWQALREKSNQVPPILLVQPHSSMTSQIEQVSHSTRGGYILKEFFHRQGLGNLSVLQEPDAATLEETINKLQPAVLYIVAAIQEIRGINHLVFTQSRRYSTQELLTAEVLARIFKRLPSNQITPLLILDIARPASTFEAAEVLALRNLFAADLLYYDCCPGILATGLAQPSMLEQLTGVIIQALAQGSTMGELVNNIRALWNFEPASQPENELDQVLAYLGTALFSSDPDLPALLR